MSMLESCYSLPSQCLQRVGDPTAWETQNLLLRTTSAIALSALALLGSLAQATKSVVKVPFTAVYVVLQHSPLRDGKITTTLQGASLQKVQKHAQKSFALLEVAFLAPVTATTSLGRQRLSSQLDFVTDKSWITKKTDQVWRQALPFIQKHQETLFAIGTLALGVLIYSRFKAPVRAAAEPTITTSNKPSITPTPFPQQTPEEHLPKEGAIFALPATSFPLSFELSLTKGLSTLSLVVGGVTLANRFLSRKKTESKDQKPPIPPPASAPKPPPALKESLAAAFQEIVKLDKIAAAPNDQALDEASNAISTFLQSILETVPENYRETLGAYVTQQLENKRKANSQQSASSEEESNRPRNKRKKLPKQTTEEIGEGIFFSRQETNTPYRLCATKHGDLFLLLEDREYNFAKGAFKEGYFAIDLQTFNLIANMTSKIFNDASQTQHARESYQKEKSIISILNSTPGVVKTYTIAVETDSETWWHFFQEYCDCGDLENVLKNNTLEEQQRWQIGYDILRTLRDIHQKNIVYFDGKPKNIVLKREQEGSMLARVTDFGLAEKIQGNTTSCETGTPYYLPPEAIQAQSSGGSLSNAHIKKADMWSWGCIFLELFKNHEPEAFPWTPKGAKTMGDFPFLQKSLKNMQAMTDDWPKWNDFLPERNIPNSLDWLIRQMLQVDPEKRISSEKAVAIFKEAAETKRIQLREAI